MKLPWQFYNALYYFVAWCVATVVLGGVSLLVIWGIL